MSTTTRTEDVPLSRRIAENPRPALLWLVGILLLVAIEFGALATASLELLRAVLDAAPGVAADHAWLSNALEAARQIPTLLSRETIPNQGYDVNGPEQVIQRGSDTAYVFHGPWEGTFMGISPRAAWALRAGLIVAYVVTFVYWLVRAYFVFREHYRVADWTPRDDVVNRLRTHRWGQFGFVIIVLFLTMALFAPALGPTTVEKNIVNPYGYDVTYYDTTTESLQNVTVGFANLEASSNGEGSRNTGPMEYDKYGRFHPFGTMPTPGQDMFTFMMSGARISLFIAVLAMAISGVLAAVFGLLTAYYKGLVDLAVVIAGDSVMTIPQLLLLILVTVVFQGHWLKNIYNGGLLLALVFGFTGWPFLWRAVRGPAFQVADQEWVDAARSYGQRSSATMRRHMLPYIIGYLLIYGSMTLGGIIITVSALSFLGLGITPPTPEWGRAIAAGQSYVATQSWHISLIPGLLIVLVVTAFNAMGDGIRDAIDPQAGGGEGGAEVAAAGGGGG